MSSIVEMLLGQPSALDQYLSMGSTLGGSAPARNAAPIADAIGGTSKWERVAHDIATNDRWDYGPRQWKHLDWIIDNPDNGESHWNPNAYNESSGAAGIAQKISGYSEDYSRNDPLEQIRWLLNYVQSRYGGANNAYNFKQEHGWY